VQGRFGAT